ncbi:MAG: hypothetical protein GC208_10410 [Alphaproteobacteria bacterium]|nr:hypothetical protein [Alphaproteobacteria bacterium]
MKNYKVSTTFTVETAQAKQQAAELAEEMKALASQASAAQAATRGLGNGLTPMAAGYETAAARADAARQAIGTVAPTAANTARQAAGSVDALTRSAEQAQRAMRALGTPTASAGTAPLVAPPRPAPVILPPAPLRLPEPVSRLTFAPVATRYQDTLDRARAAMRPPDANLAPIENQLRTVEAQAHRTRTAVASVGSGGAPPTGLRSVAAAAGNIPPSASRAASSLRELTPPINQAADAARGAERTGVGVLQRLGSGAAGLRSQLVGVVLGFASIGASVAILKGVVQDQTEIQTRAIGIAAMVNGNSPNPDWNRSLAESYALIRGMLRDAKELPGEFKHFASAANSLVAPMSQIGMGLDDVRRRAAQAVQIAMIDTSGNSPDVVGSQLGRILMGQAGMEMTTWAMLRGQLKGMQAEQFNQLPAAERARLAFGAIDRLTGDRGFQGSVARSAAVQYSQVRENILGQDGIGGSVGLWASRQMVTEAREINRIFKENPRLIDEAGSAISDVVVPAIRTGGSVVRAILTDMQSIRNVAIATGAAIATWHIAAAFAPANLPAGQSAAAAGLRVLAATGTAPIALPWRAAAPVTTTLRPGSPWATTVIPVAPGPVRQAAGRAAWTGNAVSWATAPIVNAAGWTRNMAGRTATAGLSAVGTSARATGTSNLLFTGAVLGGAALNSAAAQGTALAGVLARLGISGSGVAAVFSAIAASPVVAGLTMILIPLAAVAGAVVVIKNNLWGLGDFFKDSMRYLGQSLWGLGKNLGGLLMAIGVPLGTVLVPIISGLAILLGGAAELLTKFVNALGGAWSALWAYAGALYAGDFVGAPDAARDAWQRFSFANLMDDALEYSRERQAQADFDKKLQERMLKGSGNINIQQLILQQSFSNANEPERFAARFYEELDKLRRGRAQLPPGTAF